MRWLTVVLIVIAATVILLLHLYGIYQLAIIYSLDKKSSIVSNPELPEYGSVEPESTTPKYVVKYKFNRTMGDWEEKSVMVTDPTKSTIGVSKITMRSRRPETTTITTTLRDFTKIFTSTTVPTASTGMTTTSTIRSTTTSPSTPVTSTTRKHFPYHRHDHYNQGRRYEPTIKSIYATTFVPIRAITSRITTNRIRIKDPIDDLFPHHSLDQQRSISSKNNQFPTKYTNRSRERYNERSRYQDRYRQQYSANHHKLPTPPKAEVTKYTVQDRSHYGSNRSIRPTLFPHRTSGKLYTTTMRTISIPTTTIASTTSSTIATTTISTSTARRATVTDDPFLFETHTVPEIDGVGVWPALIAPEIKPFEDPDPDESFELSNDDEQDEDDITTTPTSTTTVSTSTVRTLPPVTRMEMSNGDITIVTALFDIGRGDWWEYRRPLNKYHEFMENLLSLRNNMVIFTDEASYDFVVSYRTKMGLMELTKVHKMRLEDLPLWRYYPYAKEIIETEHNDTERWRTIWDPQMKQHPEAKSAEYDIVVNSKTHFLYNATIENFFATDVFVWIDAGYGHGNQSVYPYDNVWRPTFPMNKISVIKLTPKHDPISGYRIENLYRRNWSVISGGFIAGDRRTIGQLHTIVHRKFIELINRDKVDDDQTTMVLAINAHPHLFNIVHGDWFDAFRKFDPIFQ